MSSETKEKPYHIGSQGMQDLFHAVPFIAEWRVDAGKRP